MLRSPNFLATSAASLAIYTPALNSISKERSLLIRIEKHHRIIPSPFQGKGKIHACPKKMKKADSEQELLSLITRYRRLCVLCNIERAIYKGKVYCSWWERLLWSLVILLPPLQVIAWSLMVYFLCLMIFLASNSPHWWREEVRAPASKLLEKSEIISNTNKNKKNKP